MSPRPILKGIPEFALGLPTSSPLPFASCSQVLDSPHVHFPPTPSLSSTEITHSPFFYDRAPIVVSPNSCALPERGGRVYKAHATHAKRAPPAEQLKGSYFHPRAFEVCEREPLGGVTPPHHHNHHLHAHHEHDHQLPSLTPDVSSESEDSDALSSPPPSSPIPRISIQFTPSSSSSSYPQHNQIPRMPSRDEADANSLLFLPYPPSPVKDKQRERDRDRESERNKQRRVQGRERTVLRGDTIRRSRMNISFCEPSLEEGCLGGF